MKHIHLQTPWNKKMVHLYSTTLPLPKYARRNFQDICPQSNNQRLKWKLTNAVFLLTNASSKHYLVLYSYQCKNKYVQL